MKSVYLLVLVSLCQALPLDSKAGLLSAPHLLRVNIIDPPAIEMTWNKIESADAKDPVIGYKVNKYNFVTRTITNYTSKVLFMYFLLTDDFRRLMERGDSKIFKFPSLAK